jgi:hypothetical protein
VVGAEGAGVSPLSETNFARVPDLYPVAAQDAPTLPDELPFKPRDDSRGLRLGMRVV